MRGKDCAAKTARQDTDRQFSECGVRAPTRRIAGRYRGSAQPNAAPARQEKLRKAASPARGLSAQDVLKMRDRRAFTDLRLTLPRSRRGSSTATSRVQGRMYLTMGISIPVSVFVLALLAGCGSSVQAGLANAPVLGGATPEAGVHDVVANGHDACEPSAFPRGEILRGQTPRCASKRAWHGSSASLAWLRRLRGSPRAIHSAYVRAPRPNSQGLNWAWWRSRFTPHENSSAAISGEQIERRTCVSF